MVGGDSHPVGRWDLKGYKPVLLETEKLERQLVSQRENSVSSTRRYWCRVGVAWPGGLGTRAAVRESISSPPGTLPGH